MDINCKGRLVSLESPRVMGILNATPNSFYDGGRYDSLPQLVRQAGKMLEEGADFIDIGGYSSKPSAEFVDEQEEIDRLLPVVEALVEEFPGILISVDTFRAKVAKAGIEAGAALINDISAGLLDAEMIPVVVAARVPYILMHMRGTPQTMVKLTQYDDIMKEMLQYFSRRIAACRAAGISDLIIDPGFGFAKTLSQNYNVLQKMELFQMTGLPLLAGLSRKSMIYKALGKDAGGALNGTTALNMVALQKGAKILRVHDVAEAVECVSLFQFLHASKP